MVIRTASHNAKISAGMKRFHQKVRTGLGADKYEKMIGAAARYRQYKNAGIKTQFQLQTIRKKFDKAQKRELRGTRKKKKPKFVRGGQWEESSEESNFLIDAINLM